MLLIKNVVLVLDTEPRVLPFHIVEGVEDERDEDEGEEEHDRDYEAHVQGECQLWLLRVHLVQEREVSQGDHHGRHEGEQQG